MDDETEEEKRLEEAAIRALNLDEDLPGESSVLLDHPWPLPSGADIPLFRLCHQPPYERLVFEVSLREVYAAYLGVHRSGPIKYSYLSTRW